MAQYIEKSALLAEIGRLKAEALQKKSQCKRSGLERMMHQIGAYNKIISFLDTLEVRKMDLDFEQELYKAFGQVKDFTLGMRIAKYFFELGLKAQKGEQNMKTGIELIAEERQRQIEVEGWTKEHDAKHKNGELAKAAICYADPNVYYHQENRIIRYRIPNEFWPIQWDIHWFKPTDRIRDLVKAGALIAAEIDRLQAQKGE